jgi:endogenous inhibitor of DNA gyrase (YacG/DUF329 family)
MKVKCPGCKQDVEWHPKSEFRPFCSKRCQLIDLGQWANEEHAIASNEHQQDLLPDTLDIEEIEAMLAQAEKESGDFFKN